MLFKMFSFEVWRRCVSLNVEHLNMYAIIMAKLQASSKEKAVPVAKWLRMLIFSAQNRSSSHRCGFKTNSVTCETSQGLLAGGQVVFLGDLSFLPHFTIDSSQNDEIILTGHKTQITKNNYQKKIHIYIFLVNFS